MKRPGGELASRPLHFIFITDCSGSMADDGKISSLNTSIREVIPHMQDVASENPNAQILIRALKFSTNATWHISEPTKVEEFKWIDLQAEGLTAMGQALGMVADQLKIPPMTERALPPVLVLVSDGQPTDDFKSGLIKLMAENWGKKSVRVAIAIGKDADPEVLQDFIGNPEIKPLLANNPEQLLKYIKFVSTDVLKAASAPPSAQTGSISAANVVIPEINDIEEISSANDVW